MKKYCIITLIILTLNGCQTSVDNLNNTSNVINRKVDSLLSIMTIDEKIGQMNQYNGFWDVTGPAPKNGDAKFKFNNLKKGLVGSMLCLLYTSDAADEQRGVDLGGRRIIKQKNYEIHTRTRHNTPKVH